MTQDLPGVLRNAFPKLFHQRTDTPRHPKDQTLLLLPEAGYAPQTRALAGLVLSRTYRRPEASLSTVAAQGVYTQNAQTYLMVIPSLWTAGDRWYLPGDFRLMHYPQATYGLGMFTVTDRVVSMDYEYARLYQSALRRVGPHVWAGGGYRLDYHWDIESRNARRELTRISAYPYGIRGTSVSSGPVAQLHYDTRTNPVNPERGLLLDGVYRYNSSLLGSDDDWQSLGLDARTYLPLGRRTVLALWGYSVLTLDGNPPFLDLPSTGWDTYSATGRGFTQGRYRGRNLAYAEAEGRFSLTRNGLLGSVVFANITSVTEQNGHRFVKWMPAAGLGLRLCLNKTARTNLAIDYGFGADGSRGLYFNLGEVF